MTWPGARRTTEVTGGLGMTGTAGRRVVRIGGPSCLDGSDAWLLNPAKAHCPYYSRLGKQLTVEGGRGKAVSGGLGFCSMAGDEGTGGWWGSSLGLLGPIFSLASSSPTKPLAL